MRQTNRVLTVVGMLVIGSVALACGGDSATAPVQVTAVGTWSLTTINGSGLPFTLAQTGANKTELTGASLVVATNTYSITFNGRNTINGVITTASSVDAGSMTANGTALTLRSNADGSIVTGSFSANTMTLSEVGGAYVFVR